MADTKFSPQEIFHPIAGQRIITLDAPYTPNSGDLTVYYNGNVVVSGKDYQETDSLTVTFLFDLELGDIVVTQHKIVFTDKIVTVVGRAGNSLYQKLGDEVRFLENQVYIAEFNYVGQSFKSEFYTTKDPLYTSLMTIRNDIGEVIADIPDKVVEYQIYENGILAENLLSTPLATGAPIPFEMRQYVRYKTELDLVLAVYLAVSAKAGSERKILGQFEVDKAVTPSDVRTMIAELKNYLRPWELKLRASTGPLRGATWAKSKFPYPLGVPRQGIMGTGGFIAGGLMQALSMAQTGAKTQGQILKSLMSK